MNIRIALATALLFASTTTPLYAQTATPSPSPTASGSPAASSSPAASPSPAASSTPIPRTITPPPGWKPLAFNLQAGPMIGDAMWASAGKGAVFTAHANTFGITDVATYGASMRKGFETMSGPNGVLASKPVNVCGGKQKAWYSEVRLKQGMQNIVEQFAVALSDRAYISAYVRSATVKDDPQAVKSILSLCAP